MIVTDGGVVWVSALIFSGSCFLKYACASTNGRVIFGEVPGGSAAFGVSARQRSNASVATLASPSAPATIPERR